MHFFLLRSILLICFLLHGCVLSGKEPIVVQVVDVSYLDNLGEIDLTLEHAVTPEQISWGLMRRKSLPGNHGMTFNYRSEQKRSFWMFNCLINLSIAFLDQDKVIREIHEMKAYPHRMDPYRPVLNPNDFNLYPPHDSVIQFFQKKSVRSKIELKYALEMIGGWFDLNQVQPGDIAQWELESDKGKILKTIDIGLYIPSENLPILLDFHEKNQLAIWAPTQTADRDIAFLSGDDKVGQTAELPGGRKYRDEEIPVLVSHSPVQKILITPPGWLKRKGITPQVVLELASNSEKR